MFPQGRPFELYGDYSTAALACSTKTRYACGMHLRPVWGAVFFLLGASGCGGQEQRPGSKSSAVTCLSGVLPDREILVDDFEDGDLKLAPVGILQGTWYVSNDGTGQQAPDPADARAGRELVARDEADAVTLALHTSGTGFSRWGAFAAVRLNSAGSQICSVDLSGHERLGLRAKGEGSFRVNLGTRATTPIVDGGECATDACSDYGASVQLTAEWRELSLPIAELTQPEWADTAALEPESTLRLSFWSEAPDFDFWVDDIRLLP